MLMDPPQPTTFRSKHSTKCKLLHQWTFKIKLYCNLPAEDAVDKSSEFLSLHFQLSSILDAFTLTSGKLNATSKSAHSLVLIHQRKRPMEKSSLICQLSLIASMLTEFAYTQFLFLSLCKEDQTTLLKNNIPLYLQYITARYFSAETGIDQLNWILEGQLALESIEEVTKISRISLREMNESVNLFTTSDMIELYSHFCNNVGIFYPFPQDCNGLIANLLLYYTCESIESELKEAKRINCIFQEAVELVRMGYQHLDRSLTSNAGDNIRPLIHTLTRMKSIFGSCKVDSSTDMATRVVPRVLSVNFTDTEGAWIKKSFYEFQTACRSVIPTKEYMEDAFKLLRSLEKVSNRYMFNWNSMMAERMMRILQVQPDFDKLTDREQFSIWNKNNKNAVTLMAVRLNLVKTGKDQVGPFNIIVNAEFLGKKIQNILFHAR